MKRRLLPTLGLAGLAILPVAILACSTSHTPAQAATKPVIKMAHNDWLGAELNDTVAQILLKEQLHYSNVELIAAGTTDQFPSIASGALHVSLEVWPSGHPDDIQKYIADQKRIEDVGVLGPIGQAGWFIPTYLMTLHPELATWQGLQSPTVVGLFATPQTAPNGQFLGGDPKWVQWDQQIITELGLSLTEEWAGSEAGILAQLDTAYKARAALLFYFYEPHWAFAAYDLSQVQLPPYKAQCFPPPSTPTPGGLQACSYPPDNLFKMVWPQLKTYAPDAYAFFKAFSYTTQDQTVMMNAVHNGQTVEQAARAWIDSHKAVWGPWIPQGE